MTRQKKPDEPTQESGTLPTANTQDAGGAAGAGDPPAPAPEPEVPAQLLSDGLEMPAAGGSYVRLGDGTLALNHADDAVAARKDDDA